MRQRRPPGPFHEFLRARIKHGDRRAIAALLGISEGNFGSWLRRGSEPGIYAAQKIAAHYGVSIDFLVTGEDFLAGSDPRVVELCRLLRQLEADADSLSVVEAVIRNRIAEKRFVVQEIATGPPHDEEERAKLPSRGR